MTRQPKGWTCCRRRTAAPAVSQESVFLGLQGLQAQQPKQVLIHDGARPFVDTDTIDRVLQGLQSSAGAIAALPVVDSLKREDQGQIAGAVERSGLWRAQTPQGFRFDEILAAHARAQGQELTDDAAVAEAAGLSVALVEGGPANIKITSQEDLMAAERWLAGGAGGDVRVGQGFDVHRFGPGDQVMLGGIAIPHHSGLVGHSDADVALHALTDALLGAVGAGDIGQHFPPSDPQWRGAPSDLFLKHAADLVRSKGGRINHLDLTVICEAPKVGRHRAAMAARIAEILGIDIGRVNVKATTTEKLGFTGREEGIAAQASATVALASR